MNEFFELTHAVRHLASSASMYGTTIGRVLGRGRPSLPVAEHRHVFVVGAPRSGTTFTAGALGSQPGFVDLGEVQPLKAALPTLYSLDEAAAADVLRRQIEIIRRAALVRRRRAVEQTPETSFVVRAALRAFPSAQAVHVLRDGRDVVCSLIERGWLAADNTARDDVGGAYGARVRFWVELERRDEFVHASEATRAAWAWRCYVTAARQAPPERTLTVRYEDVVADPPAAAAKISAFLDSPEAPLARLLSAAHTRSSGRWRRDLTPQQLEDVEREAGPLLRELGYV